MSRELTCQQKPIKTSLGDLGRLPPETRLRIYDLVFVKSAREQLSINTTCLLESALSLASKQIYEETIDIVRKHRHDPCPHRQFTVSLTEIWNRYEADAKYTKATADYPSVLSWALPQDDYLVEKTMRARMFWLEDKYTILTTKLPGSGSFGPSAARDGLSADDPEMLTFRICSLLRSKTARRIGRSRESHSQLLLPEKTPSGYSCLWDKWCRKNESVVDMLDWLSGRTRHMPESGMVARTARNNGQRRFWSREKSIPDSRQFTAPCGHNGGKLAE